MFSLVLAESFPRNIICSTFRSEDFVIVVDFLLLKSYNSYDWMAVAIWDYNNLLDLKSAELLPVSFTIEKKTWHEHCIHDKEFWALCPAYNSHAGFIIRYKIKITKEHVRTLLIIFVYLARFRRIESRLKD